ncbi:MAG TPA: hypothetical protein VF807_03110 [Ktedonobacterales bacterium]
MRLLPTPWRRRRVRSRPRVAQAAQAAHLAFASPLGSALAGPAFYLAPPTPSGSSGAPLAPGLLLATTRAAWAMGRLPAGVQADAVRAWEAAQMPVRLSPLAKGRRQAVWHEIDATLATLRAS